MIKRLLFDRRMGQPQSLSLSQKHLFLAVPAVWMLEVQYVQHLRRSIENKDTYIRVRLSWIKPVKPRHCHVNYKHFMYVYVKSSMGPPEPAALWPITRSELFQSRATDGAGGWGGWTHDIVVIFSELSRADVWRSVWSVSNCWLLPDGCVDEPSCWLHGARPQAGGHRSHSSPSLQHQTKKPQTCSELSAVCVYFWASFVHLRCKNVLLVFLS